MVGRETMARYRSCQTCQHRIHAKPDACALTELLGVLRSCRDERHAIGGRCGPNGENWNKDEDEQEVAHA